MELIVPHVGSVHSYLQQIKKGLVTEECAPPPPDASLSILHANPHALIEAIDGMRTKKPYWDRGRLVIPPFATETFWLISHRSHEECVVGELALRRQFNTPEIRNIIGDISLGVAPNCRKKGHASRMLKLALNIMAKTHNAPEVLLVCTCTNSVAQRLIIANGGELEEEFREPNHQGMNLRRYRIDLAAT